MFLFLIILGLVLGTIFSLLNKWSTPLSFLCALALIIIALHLPYPRWMYIIGFSILSLIVIFIVCDKYNWIKVGKILTVVFSTIIALTIIVVIIDTIMLHVAIASDKRITSLVNSITLNNNNLDLKDYKMTEEYSLEKPYVYYFLNASDGATSLNNCIANYRGAFFPTSGDISNTKTVIIAVRYNSIGYMYNVYRNGVKTTGEKAVYQKKGDLYIFNMEKKNCHVIKGIIEGELPDEHGGGNISFSRYEMFDAMKDFFKKEEPKKDKSNPGFIAHKGEINALAFTPDGKMLISGGADKSIKIWSIQQDTLLKIIVDNNLPNGSDAHKGSVRSLAISPDGKLLVSCSFDKTIKFWSLPKGELLKTIDNQEERMLSVVISTDGKVVASSSYAHDIKLWNIPDGDLLKTINLNEYTGSLTFSPNDNILASRGDDNKTIQLWDYSTGNRLQNMKSNQINKLSISPDGKWLASGEYNIIKIWSLPDGNLKKTINAGGEWTQSLAISKDSKILISGDLFNYITLWSIPEGKELKIIHRGKHIIYCLAVSPDGTIFASGDSNGTIQLWSLPEGNAYAR